MLFVAIVSPRAKHFRLWFERDEEHGAGGQRGGPVLPARRQGVPGVRQVRGGGAVQGVQRLDDTSAV